MIQDGIRNSTETYNSAHIYFIVKRPKYTFIQIACVYDTCKCFTLLCVPYTDAMLLNISLVDVDRARSNRSQNKSIK